MNETLAPTFPVFTCVTLVFLAFSILLRFWLAWRQARHVAAHRNTVPRSFTDRVPLTAHQKAADYTLAKTRLGMMGIAVETLAFLAFTWGGGLSALHAFWDARLTGVAYGVALIASALTLSVLIDLPLSFYQQFRVEARFGFNRMNPRLFCVDFIKQILIAALLGLPLLAAALWLMDAMGKNWWFYVWLLWIGFNLLILFVYPLWIAPFFNRFTPLPDGEIKTRVKALLQRGDFGDREFYVMDGSRRSSHGNAYFTGFGKARRIVFFDTLLEKLTPPQVEAVLAHELGHFHHRHVIKRIVGIFALSLLFFVALDQLIAAPWFFHDLGVDTENTALAYTLFILVMPWFTFPITPLFSAWSRRYEFEADTYAARMTRAEDLVAALVKLYEDNATTLTPDPLHSLFYDSHPSAGERVAHLRALPA
ncbi:MAG: M48 family metallopeptidase [Zoogloeaceae bacterium]|jgi:STE24 endopeptidase|nr:M48 family metallopeptidase [Zoogloeaceae bacterium]